MLVTGESRGFTELGQSPLCIQSLQKTVYDVKVTKNITFLLGKLVHCLQCFDAVGWAAGRASGL